MQSTINISHALAGVKYDIRGRLSRRAYELERQGYEIISLNIGNPGLFGYRTPETMRLAMIENLGQAEPNSHQKGIFPAREAIVMQQQDRGLSGISVNEVFVGNGVSELIDLSLRALLNPGDEVRRVPVTKIKLVIAGDEICRRNVIDEIQRIDHLLAMPDLAFE
jgi:alanine-synthesizing transaminase